jgi:hypothetical protein
MILLGLKMYKKLALLLLCIVTSLQAEELNYQHSIAMDIPSFHEKADALHIMTHTNKFSILPVSRHNAAFIQTPQVPGADPISSLVGALIATSIINGQNARENDAAARFNADLAAILQSMDINQEFSAALQEKLSEQLANTQFEFEHVDSRNTLNQAGLLVRIKQNYILTFENRLYFDSKLQSLCFETSPRLWVKDKVNPFYLSEIKYISHQLIGQDKNLLKASWTQNGGERLKQSIRDGVHVAVEMFIQDFLDKTWKTGPASTVREISFIDTHSGKASKNQLFLLAETPDRIAGRMFAHDAAQLISIPKSQLISQAAP